MTLQLIREAYPIAEVGRERPRLVTVGIDERVHIDTREVDRYHNSTRLMGMVGRPSLPRGCRESRTVTGRTSLAPQDSSAHHPRRK